MAGSIVNSAAPALHGPCARLVVGPPFIVPDMSRLLGELGPIRIRKVDRRTGGAVATIGIRSWDLIFRRAASPFTVRFAEFDGRFR
jgi:hypothetical protein